jgi:hypothetical protein
VPRVGWSADARGSPPAPNIAAAAAAAAAAADTAAPPFSPRPHRQLVTLLGAAALVLYVATQVFGWGKPADDGASSAPSAPPMPVDEWPGAPPGAPPGAWQPPYGQQSPRYSLVYDAPSSSGSVNQPYGARAPPQQQGDVIDVWYGGGGSSSGSSSSTPPPGGSPR